MIIYEVSYIWNMMFNKVKYSQPLVFINKNINLFSAKHLLVDYPGYH